MLTTEHSVHAATIAPTAAALVIAHEQPWLAVERDDCFAGASSHLSRLRQTAPIGQMQSPPGAAAYDRFARPDVAELTIELATKR